MSLAQFVSLPGTLKLILAAISKVSNFYTINDFLQSIGPYLLSLYYFSRKKMVHVHLNRVSFLFCETPVRLLWPVVKIRTAVYNYVFGSDQGQNHVRHLN